MDDRNTGPVPDSLVEAFLDHEHGTVALLDDLEARALAGEAEAVREKIRGFAAEHRDVFFAVALALEADDGVFADLESRFDEETVSKLRDLSDRYPSLSEPFALVRLEVSKERTNPVTTIDVTTTYSPTEEVPIIEYSAYSGDVKLYEHRGTPQEVLQSAGYLLQATNDSLSAALDQDRSVNTDELSALIDRREKLESELSTLRDNLDELRRKPVDG